MSIALAKSMALSGARTLIIDADLRKPTIHEYLGLEGENGLVEFLKKHEAYGVARPIIQDAGGYKS